MSSSSPLLLYTHPKTGELLRRRWQLKIIDGHDRGVSGEIDHSPALVGAAPAATLVITDDTVSRYHAEIDVFADGLRVRDLDSTNGTFIGEQRIRDAFVEDGREFRVGRTIVRVIAVDEAAASEIDTDPHGVPPGAVELLGGALGVAGVTRELLRLVRKIAFSSSAVLFEGEAGTGKATLARLLHDLSARRDQPFITFSPRAAGNDSDIEQILFGCGSARNGAGTPQPGLFENVKGGTLFIEGIDHLPESLHLPLLRTIESGEIQRPGGERKHRIDVRLVSSTTTSLEAAPELQAALYRRISVVRLRVPSLRERPEDIGPLAAHFLRERRGRDIPLGERTLALLTRLSWPGNIDQLRELMAAMMPAVAEEGAKERGRDEMKDAMIAEALRCAFVTDLVALEHGHVSRAAEELAMSPGALFRYLAAHDIDLEMM